MAKMNAEVLAHDRLHEWKINLQKEKLRVETAQRLKAHSDISITQS
jgi:hypothetical protein